MSELGGVEEEASSIVGVGRTSGVVVAAGALNVVVAVGAIVSGVLVASTMGVDVAVLSVVLAVGGVEEAAVEVPVVPGMDDEVVDDVEVAGADLVEGEVPQAPGVFCQSPFTIVTQ